MTTQVNNFQCQSDLSAADLSAADFDWLAFQYVSGDLAAAELARFEKLLAADLSACEAVARQVMICETVATTPAMAAISPGSHTTNPRIPQAGQSHQPTLTITNSSTTGALTERSVSRWVGVISAAVCLGLAMWMGLFAPGGSASENSQSFTASDQLVQYWVDMKQDVGEPDDMVSSHVDELSVWEDSETELKFTSIDSELVPTDWMLAAVSTSEMDEELDMPEEVFE